MKRLILTGAAAFSLAACASGPSAYGPATSASSLGFQNTKIQNDRFRVSYTARSPNEAKDYALLRAAQITLNEGYSHFKILTGDLHGNGGRSPVSSSVGIGVGSGGYRGRSRTNVGVGVGVADLGRAMQGDKVTNTIEIKLKHSGGSDPDTYDAASVQNSIRPQVFTP